MAAALRANEGLHELDVSANRLGDLGAFRTAMETHAKVFVADTNHTLIMRLRQNVIRAGLRNISLAYSKIALTDVAQKLALDHPEDMELIASKVRAAGCTLAARARGLHPRGACAAPQRATDHARACRGGRARRRSATA